MNHMASASPVRKSYLIDQMNPFNGTPVDLLNLYTAREGNGWDYRDGEIVISRFVTRTYQIASLLDINDMSASINKSSSVGTASSSQTGGNAGSTSSAADVSSKISAKFDLVKGLETALSGVTTPEVGKVSISSSGIVTVTDTREVQEQVKEIIEAENKNVGKQVRLRLQIVQVDLNRLDDMGVDWSWLINNTARKWNVNLKAPSGLPAGSTGVGQIGIIHNGDNSKTTLFIKSLSELGRVTVNKDEAYPTINNRMLSVSTTENFVYPAKSSAAATTSGETSAVPGVEPGMLTTGTFINMRASIQPNGSVITQFSLDASIRGKTETFDQNGIKIVYPSHSGNQYQIYSTSVSGDTAVLAGIENVERRSTDRSLDGSLSPLLGGGISASTNRRLVLILLTPTIIEGVS
jgi:type IVB pilus formation R64 PilN family outer membrane protein